MVLTRQKCKDLGIIPDKEEVQMVSRGKQAKITYYYQSNENANKTKDKAESKENLIHETLVTDWDVNNLPPWLPNNEGDNSFLNLAQEIEEAEGQGVSQDLSWFMNETITSVVDEEGSMPPLESSGCYDEYKISPQLIATYTEKTKEPELFNLQATTIKDDWCQMVSQSLTQIAKFVAEANLLLTTLTEFIVKRELYTDTETKTVNTDTQASQTNQRIDLHLVAKKEKSSKLPTQAVKKSKNDKSTRSHRRCHMKFERLFKLLETTKEPTEKRNIKRKRKKKNGKIKTKVLPDVENSQSSPKESIQGSLIMKNKPENLNFNLQIHDAHEQIAMDMDNTKPSHPNQKDRLWELTLSEIKLAIINFPKPKGYLTQKERKKHLIKTVDESSPGLIKMKDIINIKYLFYNYINARAVVTSRRKTKQLYSIARENCW
ncbi:uncharacterized protein LOC133390541 [Rhineura floridana]|uniref:uncharacterized protein LOC133390541 n=1 Tax=Rhineura floridana TaxID=261503 RepID=UPI002AC81396|nr:uncharacterized protein LOC133390541 [Rhineura floridana]